MLRSNRRTRVPSRLSTAHRHASPARAVSFAHRNKIRRGRHRNLLLLIRNFHHPRILGPAGFEPARDIEAITVNRWPHGYAYEYNSLFDPDWPEADRPCVVGRQPFGRITSANADAGAYAYTDSAIDQAYRAVREIVASTLSAPKGTPPA